MKQAQLVQMTCIIYIHWENPQSQIEGIRRLFFRIVKIQTYKSNLAEKRNEVDLQGKVFVWEAAGRGVPHHESLPGQSTGIYHDIKFNRPVFIEI